MIAICICVKRLKNEEIDICFHSVCWLPIVLTCSCCCCYPYPWSIENCANCVSLCNPNNHVLGVDK